MNYPKLVAVLLSMLMLSSCIYRDLSEDYRKADDIKSLEMPSGMAPIRQEPLYPIPDIEIREEAFYDISTDGFVVPRPEAMSAEREQAKVKIQKVGQYRWILIEASTSQVWPLTQSFLSQVGVHVLERQPSTGLVLTDWVVFKSDPTMQSQYEIRIEQGLRPDTAEVHVLQRETQANEPSQNAIHPDSIPQWKPVSMNLERESWMLEELANSLAGNIHNNAASLLGQTVGGEVKARLFMQQGEPLLGLKLEKDRAWATLLHSLSKEGFGLIDSSSDLGVFYASFSEDTVKRGWFKRLFTREPKASEIGDSTLKLTQLLENLDSGAAVQDVFAQLDGVRFGGEALEGAHGYLIVLRSVDGGYNLRIRDSRGRPLELKKNKQLLSTIRRNLI